METTRLAGGPVEEYLAGVRAALADLPAAEVGEILDDVGAHLADLSAELGPDAGLEGLVARLGTPAAYAEELRTAAGYPAAPEVPDRPARGVARLAVVGLIGSALLMIIGVVFMTMGLLLAAALLPLVGLPVLVRDGPRLPTVAALPEVRRFVAARPAPGSAARSVADFVASLQPAWWLARAILAAALVVAVFRGVFDGLGLGPVLLMALVAVPVSVWLGARSRRDRRWLWLVVPLNAFAVALAAVGLLASAGFAAGYSSGPSPAFAEATPAPGPYLGDGLVRDIRPVDAQGAPLTGIYLFDQDGRALELADPGCAGGDSATVTAAPRPFPRGTSEYDEVGRCVTVPPPPLVVAIPSTTPNPAPPSVTADPVPATTAPPPPTG